MRILDYDVGDDYRQLDRGRIARHQSDRQGRGDVIRQLHTDWHGPILLLRSDHLCHSVLLLGHRLGVTSDAVKRPSDFGNHIAHRSGLLLLRGLLQTNWFLRKRLLDQHHQRVLRRCGSHDNNDPGQLHRHSIFRNRRDRHSDGHIVKRDTDRVGAVLLLRSDYLGHLMCHFLGERRRVPSNALIRFGYVDNGVANLSRLLLLVSGVHADRLLHRLAIHNDDQ